jgi:hypothetical protein
MPGVDECRPGSVRALGIVANVERDLAGATGDVERLARIGGPEVAILVVVDRLGHATVADDRVVFGSDELRRSAGLQL